MFVSKQAIRSSNTNMVLNYIYYNQPISRSEISEQTGLNKASVSEISRILLNNSFIKEVGAGESTDVGGRRPIMLEFNHKIGIVLGIDIGINSIRVSETYLNGEVINEYKYPIQLDNVTKQIKEIIDDQTKKKNRLVSVTLSIQGIVNQNDIVFTPNYDIPNVIQLKEDYDFPIFIQNEANLAALAHSFKYQEENIAAVTLRTGVGSGIIFDNKIYTGGSGGAGELGHNIVFPQGKACRCGNEGCLEQYTSEKALLEEYKNKTNKNITMEQLAMEYASENVDAVTVIDEMIDFFRIGLNNFITLYDIPTVYLIGNIVDNIPDFHKQVSEGQNSIFTSNKSILSSPIGKYSSAYGACIYSIKDYLENFDEY